MSQFSKRVEHVHGHMLNCVQFMSQFSEDRFIRVRDVQSLFMLIANDLESAIDDEPIWAERNSKAPLDVISIDKDNNTTVVRLHGTEFIVDRIVDGDVTHV